MKHLWKEADPSASPGVYSTSVCKRCGLQRRWENMAGSWRWMYFVDGLYRRRGPVCHVKTAPVAGPLDGPTFRWRDFNFTLEPNALLRPWWVASVLDPRRPGREMFLIHVGPRIAGDGAVDELLFQAIVSLPSLEEGTEPFELAHAVGVDPKTVLDVAMADAETNAASLTTMLKVINDSVTTPGWPTLDLENVKGLEPNKFHDLGFRKR